MDKSLITKKLLIEINTLKCSNFKLLDETERNGLSLTFLKWYIDYAIKNCVGITEIEIVTLLKRNLKTVDKVKHAFDFESFKNIVSQSLLSKPISRDLKIKASEEIKIFYPHWTDKEIDTVISKLWNRFYLLFTNDPSFILEIIHIGYYDVKINLKEEDTEIKISHWTKQNFIAQIANLYFNGSSKKEKIKMVNIDDYPNIAFDESIAEENCYDKLDNYYNWIIKDKILTGRELKFLVFIIKTIKESNEKGNFSKILKQIALEEGFTDVNYRKILSELSKVMKKPENKKYKDLLLTYVNSEEDEIQQITELIINLIETQLIMKNHLQAYRFSEQEMNKMIELKGIFEKNDFKIDRFPEVYYDTYDNYLIVYNKEREKNQSSEEKKLDNLFSDYENIRNIKIGNEIPIDLLGVYTDFDIKGNKVKTKEGVIVLFKDRIETLGLNFDYVRFVVLMHELGHWLSHFPRYDESNWENGYSSEHKKTHESFAQLIAYWAVDGNPKLEDILERLTPDDKKDPYALYKNLTGLSKSSVLTKLIEIRKHYFLPDLILYSFLKYSETNVMLDFFGKYLFSREIDVEIISNCGNSIDCDSAIDFFEKLKDIIEKVMKEDNNSNTKQKFEELMSKILPTEELIKEFKEIIFKNRGNILRNRTGL